MNFTKNSYVPMLLLSAFLAGSAQADTSYNIAFTDTTASPTFSDAVGTFTINGSDQLTSFDVSFTVLKAYTFEYAHGLPGDVITFNTASLGATPVTYNPATGYFGVSYNYSFAPTENQASDPNNGAFVDISGGYSALGYYYDIDAFSQGIFSSGAIDAGHWVVTLSSATPGAAPEPASVAIFSIGLVALAFAIRRGRKTSPSR